MSDHRNNVFSVPRLLMALTTLATLTFGMFVFEAERALNKLDAIDVQNSMQSTSIAVHDAAIERLNKTEETLANIVAQHENRITTIEVRRAP